MSDKLKTLLDRRAKAWAQAQDIRNRVEREENVNLTNEDNETLTRALDEVELYDGLVEQEERAKAIDAASVSAPTPEAPASRTGEVDADVAYRDAFVAYMREGMAGLNAEQRATLQRGADNDPEIRALAGGTGSAGGFTIPTDMLHKMTETMKAFGGLLGVANVITTTSGNTLNWPTVNDTGNVGAILADNTQIAEQDAAFGQNDLSAYTYTSKLMRVPWNLLQDSAFDLEGFLAKIAGQRIGRALAPHLVTGDGSAKPSGLFAGATSGATSAGAAAVTLDDLIELQHSVDPAYRAAGRCRFVLNDKTLKALRKVKDTTGQYIWQPSVQAGVPSLLLGDPYTIDQGVADIATTAKAVGYGDVEAAFTVRQVAGGTLVVLRERYADFLQNGYFAFQRFDSTVDDSAAFKVLTQA